MKTEPSDEADNQRISSRYEKLDLFLALILAGSYNVTTTFDCMITTKRYSVCVRLATVAMSNGNSGRRRHSKNKKDLVITKWIKELKLWDLRST